MLHPMKYTYPVLKIASVSWWKMTASEIYLVKVSIYCVHPNRTAVQWCNKLPITALISLHRLQSKAGHLVHTTQWYYTTGSCIWICIGNQKHVDLCLQGSENLYMCSSQIDRSNAGIYCFLTTFWCIMIIRHLVQNFFLNRQYYVCSLH